MSLQDKTVVELKALARERGLKRYSKLKKADLIQLLNVPASLLDEDVPEIGLPDPVQPVQAPFPKTKTPLSKPLEKLKQFGEWLFSYIPPRPRVLDATFNALKQKVMSLYKKSFEVKESESALGGFTTKYTIEGQAGYDPNTFFNKVKESVIDLFKSNPSTKVMLSLKCVMERQDIKTGEVVFNLPYFNSDPEVNLEGTNVNDLYQEMTDKILEGIAKYNKGGSNFIFKQILSLEIHTVQYEPLGGSSYIELPESLANKNATVNPKNTDNKCFMWSVTRALNMTDKHPERIDSKLIKASEELNWDGITFPVDLKQIDRFEKQNDSLSINVFGYANLVYPLRISKFDREKQVDLLLLVSDEDKQHYCLIKSMSRLLSMQTSKHKEKCFICRRCLNSSNSEGSLAKHTDYCSSHEAIKIEMPQEGSVLKFKHFFKSMRVPFVVYADFESFTQQLDTSQPNPECSYTKQYQKHIPSGFCYYIKCFDDSVYNQDPVMYTKQSKDEDVAQIFVEMLEKDLKAVYAANGKAKMTLTPEEQKAFRHATTCWICEEALVKDQSQEDYKKKQPVRDHCHFTGEYRGAAHSLCNLQFRKPMFTPILFHNLSGYDSHLFIKNLGKTEGKIDCIPNNEERYISFSKDIKVFNDTDKKTGDAVYKSHTMRFIDSFKFMSSSLDRLTSNLTACGECDSCGLGDCLKPTTKRLRETSKICGEKVRLLVRKGVYPYDYMDSLERLNETQLPPKEAFYSKLNKSHISDEAYEHAQKVWSEFDCETMRDYHDLYLKSDMLLLADVFENFRDVCLTNYELDPAWYYTAPGLAWDAALKKTEVELELLSDPDMLLMVEKGIRGGVSSIMHRYSKANNKYMGEDYNPTEPSKYLQYLDANNLYGWAMSRPLPTKGFKWMAEKELQDWNNHTCILEVDLEYPKELHDAHNEYPLAPERVEVNKVMKLIPNLNEKEKYVLYFENLNLYESLGLVIKKIHRGIRFEESPWLKSYIDLNTSLRARATNEFEKDFFKLMNNAVFGKTMENIRNRVDIQLVNNKMKAKKLAAKPNYMHCTIFDEDFIAIHMKKTKLVFNKPVYLGMCILDLSKTLMYDFHYNYIKKKYGSKAKLLFTDTDSLAYEIETEDFYKDISGDVRTNFDTSDIPKDHPSGIELGVNKKVIGMFKDECGGKIMQEFVGLRAKLYSYKMYEGDETKKCKGVKSSVVKKEITFKDYKDCLFGGLADGKQMRTMNVIRSHRHEVYTEQVNKIALSAEDDKRVVLEDRVHTLARGHYSLKF